MVQKKMPTHFILHCTAGSGNFLRTIKSQNKKSPKLGYHFLVDRDGTFTQCVHPDLSCHHAGGDGNISEQRYGKHIGGYRSSIGLSFCNIAGDAYKLAPGESRKKEPRPLKLPGFAGYVQANPFSYDDDNHNMKKSSRVKWHEKYSQAQMDTGMKIAAVCCLRYGIDPDMMWSHQSITTKGDPGATFYPVESEQGIKYDPNLELFKQKVRAMMPQMKGKQLLDYQGRIVAGYPEAPPEPPTGSAPGPGDKPPGPDDPVDHEGKKIPK